jgi:hypothetical protein
MHNQNVKKDSYRHPRPSKENAKSLHNLLLESRDPVFEIGPLLWYYAAQICNPVPTFRNNLSVPSSAVKKEIGQIGCPETLAQNYDSTLRNAPEERRSHQHRGGSLKLLTYLYLLYYIFHSIFLKNTLNFTHNVITVLWLIYLLKRGEQNESKGGGCSDCRRFWFYAISQI